MPQASSVTGGPLAMQAPVLHPRKQYDLTVSPITPKTLFSSQPHIFSSKYKRIDDVLHASSWNGRSWRKPVVYWGISFSKTFGTTKRLSGSF